ncbi:MAG: DUF4198 domain-containing protein [Phycisphaerae bacterium]|nr:DUF4198 domain-containing protein [Phycisphaerae bacterium]
MLGRNPILVVKLCLCLVPAIPGMAWGHDSWLIADSERVMPGTSVRLSFRTGEIFPISDAPTRTDRIASFSMLRGKRVSAIDQYDVEDMSLVANPFLPTPGYAVMGCALKPRLITLSAGNFDAYLADESADDAIRIRQQRGRPASDVIEQYTKMAKTVIAAGEPEASDESYLLPIGHRLEFVPLSNPLAWRVGGRAEFRVLLDGHAWPGVSVSAGHDGVSAHGYAARTKTDHAGIVSLELPVAGLWFVKAHLIREADPLAEQSWESFWASFTFRVDGGSAEPATTPTRSPDLIPSTASEPKTSGAAPGAIAESDMAADIRSIVAVHGEIDPWAALGFRMGRRALAELGLPRGSPRLLAVHRTPFEHPYTFIADGVQSATGASIGRLTLLVAKCDRTAMLTTFFDQSTGKGIAIQLTEAAWKACESGHSKADLERAAILVLSQPEELLFRQTEAETMPTQNDIHPTPTTGPSVDSSGLRRLVLPDSVAARDSNAGSHALTRVGLAASLALACR